MNVFFVLGVYESLPDGSVRSGWGGNAPLLHNTTYVFSHTADVWDGY